MFWKKKKNPVESTVQHLANLMGTSVANFIPEPPNDKIDLETELFIRNNVAIASLVIIAGLIKGNSNQRMLILSSIEPDQLGKKSFENYLFTIITEKLRKNQEVASKTIKQRIPEYSQVIYGEPETRGSLEGNYFKWSQIQSFEPTDAQIARSIEQRQNWAKKRISW